jgi:glycosyltransferase involved in cell wall biosynthesis
MRVLAIIRLGHVKARDYLSPVVASELVDHLTVVRYAPIELPGSKVTQVIHGTKLGEHTGHDSPLAKSANLWNVIGWMVGRLTGSAVVVCLIGTDFNRWVKRSAVSFLLRGILRNADAVTIFGQAAKDYLVGRGIGEGRIFVLPNTIDHTAFTPDPSQTPEFDLIFTGFLRQPKRVDLVLHMLQVIRKSRPETTLLIVGDGEERQALERLSTELGFADRVTFFGQTDNVAAQLRRARIFVSLSETEGLPTATIEAMCVGLPVVVTDVGAMNTLVIPGENGHLVDSPADPALAAKYALKLLDDPAHSAMLGTAARVAGQHYGHTAATAVWDQILPTLPRRNA